MATARIPNDLQRSDSPIAGDAAVYARLVIAREDDQVARKNLLRPTTLIGAAPRCNIQLVSPEVSQLHCAILLDDGVLRVRDLRSRSGILLNGERIDAGVLTDGDRLQVGEFVFNVETNLRRDAVKQSSTGDTSPEIDVAGISARDQQVEQELQNREAELEARENELRREWAAHQKQQHQIAQDHEALAEDRERLQRERDVLTRQTTELATQQQQLAAEQEKLSERIQDLDGREQQFDERQTELEQQDQAIAEGQKALAELRTKLQQERRVLDEQDSRLAGEQAELVIQFERLATEQHQFDEVREAHSREVERLAGDQDLLEQERGRIGELTQSLDEREQSLADKSRLFEADGEKLDQRRHSLEAAEQELAARQAELAERSDAAGRRAAELDALQTSLQKLSIAQQKLQQALGADLLGAEDTLARASRKSVEHERRVKRFQKDQQQHEQEQISLDAERHKLREAETQLAAQNEALTQLREELAEERVAVEALRDELERQKNELDRRNAAFTQQRLKESRQRHAARLGRLRARRRELNDRQRLVDEQSAAMQQKVEIFESESRAAGEREEQLRKDAAEQQQRSVALAKRAAVLTDAETSLSAGHTQYLKQLSTLRDDLNQLRADLDSASRKIVGDQQRLDVAFDSWALTSFAPSVADASQTNPTSGPKGIDESIGVDEDALLERAVAAGVVQSDCVERLRSTAGQADAPLLERLIAEGAITQFQLHQLKTGKADHLLVDEYLLMEPIGRGQWSEVWKVRSRQTEDIYALRRIQKRWHYQAQVATAILRTWRMTADLDSPHIVRAHRISMDGRLPIALFEFVDGPSLEHLLTRTGPLAPAVAARLAGMIARGLVATSRKGFVHRRLTPAGILIASDGTAKISRVGYPNIAAGLSGSPEPCAEKQTRERYLAPELAARLRSDVRSDLFSLGCIVIEMLGGNRPDLVERQEGDGSELSRFARQLIAQNPDDRPADAATVVQTLDRIETGLCQLPQQQTAWEGLVRTLNPSETF